MEIKIDKSLLSIEQLESLQILDETIKQAIIRQCSEGAGRALQVEYGTALVMGSSKDTYRINHNASFELSHSYVIVDEVNSILRRYFSENNLPETLLKISLTFSFRQTPPPMPQETNKSMGTGTKEEAMVYIPIEPRYSFDKIVLPQRVRDDLMSAVKVIEYRDLIFNQWGYGEIDSFARCVINMYGPAGTGKTMCAHAIAHHVGKKLLALNYSEIESKYLGEAAKNLAAAFETARQTDTVIFFDEADSFLGKRVQNVTQSSDQALNSLRSQMLILLEKFDGIVIFATNLVSNFDEAFMSRIQKHIKFELPDEAQRAEIVKRQIPPRLPLSRTFTAEDFTEISKCGEALSGREIKNAIFEMLLKRADNSLNITFSPEDFANALAAKVESNKQIEEEKNRVIKERIMKKMAEKLQEQAIENKDTQSSANANPTSDSSRSPANN